MSSQVEQMESHMPEVKMEEPLACGDCGFRTPSEEILRQHNCRKTQTEEKLYKCDQCDYSAEWKKLLRKHKRKHTKPYMCGECGYRTHCKGGLVRHMGTHTGEKFKCNECDFCTPEKCQLNRHQANHAIERKRIQEETLRLSRSQNLQKKIDTITIAIPKQQKQKEEHLVCGGCGYRSRYEEVLRKHYCKKPQYRFDHCDYSTMLKNFWDEHQAEHINGDKFIISEETFHGKLRKTDSTLQVEQGTSHMQAKCKIVDEPLVCSVCGYSTRYEEILRRHNCKKPPQAPQTPRKKRWKIPMVYCDYPVPQLDMYSHQKQSKSQLDHCHKQSTPPKQTKEKLYMCGKSRKSQLDRHQAKHTKEEPYLCEETSDAEDGHQAIHTKEEPYMSEETFDGGFRMADSDSASYVKQEKPDDTVHVWEVVDQLVLSETREST
ncbi:PREDICTED: zinc finger protein 91-like [Branchiostoma belcheri]|uniref:Zinc finger protein 91-like n=1 Tax=Branchiostoma belcheri TaxID=7741 RepID=A0A6P4Z8Y0_BRABE|nr:PREDICTED: zinc finger protein 91-like [Branchiostoma belcheri]